MKQKNDLLVIARGLLSLGTKLAKLAAPNSKVVGNQVRTQEKNISRAVKFAEQHGQRVKELRAQGLKAPQIAREMTEEGTNVSTYIIRRTCRLLDVPASKGPGPLLRPTPRMLQIVELRKEGRTYQEISKKFGVTRERIRQLLRKFETITGEQGLTGVLPAAPKPTKPCAYCGTPFVGTANCCSQKHGGQWRSRRLLEADAERKSRIEQIITLRLLRYPWQDCAAGVHIHPLKVQRLVRQYQNAYPDAYDYDAIWKHLPQGTHAYGAPAKRIPVAELVA